MKFNCCFHSQYNKLKYDISYMNDISYARIYSITVSFARNTLSASDICSNVPTNILFYLSSFPMSISTISSREFNQDVSRAKRAALNGPVFITDRHQPAHVLLSIEEYRQITDSKQSIVELLAMPDAADIDFTPPQLGKNLYQPADLS